MPRKAKPKPVVGTAPPEVRVVEAPAKERIVEAVLEAEETAQASAEVTEETTPAEDGPEVKVGYVVGVTTEGNFAFKVIGKEPTLLEVLGLHDHAQRKINLLYTQNQGGGDTLVLELGKLVTELDQKVTTLLQKVAPTKPDNKL